MKEATQFQIGMAGLSAMARDRSNAARNAAGSENQNAARQSNHESSFFDNSL